MRNIMGILFLAVALSACTTATTNTTGTPTTAAQQVTGVSYSAYIAADAAWLGYLKLPNPDKGFIRAVEEKRIPARAALDQYAATGTAADQAAFNAALTAWTTAMLAGGVKVAK